MVVSHLLQDRINDRRKARCIEETIEVSTMLSVGAHTADSELIAREKRLLRTQRDDDRSLRQAGERAGYFDAVNMWGSEPRQLQPVDVSNMRASPCSVPDISKSSSARNRTSTRHESKYAQHMGSSQGLGHGARRLELAQRRTGLSRDRRHSPLPLLARLKRPRPPRTTYHGPFGCWASDSQLPDVARQKRARDAPLLKGG